MKLKVHSIHFDADQKLLDFIQGKLDKLEQFYDGILGGEVYLRVEKAKSDENKLVEVKLAIAGKDLFAKRQCKSFEEAVDHVVEALRKQLRKKKTKQEKAMTAA